MIAAIIDTQFILVIGTALITGLVAFIFVFINLYRKAQLTLQLERQKFHQELLQTEVEIREHTLENIARDLHDNFGQIASLIKINLNLLSNDISSSDQLRIAESKDLLTNLIGDIRVLSASLSAENIKQRSLGDLISSDLTRVERTGAMKTDFENIADFGLLKPEVKIFLYRMFQEMINNILKHSEAHVVHVFFGQVKSHLILDVKDDGIGISADQLKLANHGLTGNGLLNIKERCKIIGAEVIFSSVENKGTQICIKLPLDQNRNE